MVVAVIALLANGGVALVLYRFRDGEMESSNYRFEQPKMIWAVVVVSKRHVFDTARRSAEWPGVARRSPRLGDRGLQPDRVDADEEGVAGSAERGEVEAAVDPRIVAVKEHLVL